MGQYYRPLIISADDTIVTLSAHSFGNGAKLTEHSWIGNDFVGAVYSLIHRRPQKVAWIGDYAYQDYDSTQEAYSSTISTEDFQKFYDIAWEDEDNRLMSPKLFSESDLRLLDYDTKGMYLVNHGSSSYLNLEKYIKRCTVKSGDWEGWCVNPLPLLTACGNDRGGGDFRANCIGYENVGVWAFDPLEYTDQIPNGYQEDCYEFFDS